ncbi:MAG: hypothetical protein Q4C77_07810 [Eubacteriales bacterium]|nr:hypothetical protein [Eubacteriales bacterium]
MKIKSCKSIIHILLIAAGFLMAVQIVLGFLWISKNLMAIPIFGDSGEYLELSRTLALWDC